MIRLPIQPDCSQLIEYFEGTKRGAYQDQAGVWTIGVGHTGADVKQGMVATDDQIKKWLQDDIETACHIICKYAKNCHEWPDDAYMAIVSFVFNLGPKAFWDAGKKVYTHFNQVINNYENPKEVADQMMRWVYCAGKVNNGLVKRRTIESQFWLDGFKQVVLPEPFQGIIK